MNHMWKRATALLLILVMAVALLAGCSGKQETAGGGDGKSLKIGYCLPLTGAYADFGNEVKDTTELYLKDINYKVGDITIVPVWIDTQGDPEAGTKAYEQAVVQDGIQMSMYCQFSSVAVAVMEVAAKYGIPHVCSTGATALVNEKWQSDEKYHVWLKAYPSPDKLSVAYAEVINEAVESGIWTPKQMKYFSFGEDTDWGRSFSAAVGDSFAAKGWEVVGEDYFKAGETDFYAMLNKVKASGATVLAGNINSAPSAAALLKQAREVNLEALIVVDALSEDGRFYEMAGAASDYALDSRAMYSGDEGKALEKRLTETYNYPSSPAGGCFTWDHMAWAMGLIELVASKNETVDSATIYKTIQEEVWTGKYVRDDLYSVPCLKYSEANLPDPEVGTDAFIFPVMQFFGGEPKVVYPDTMKTDDLKIPDYMK